MTQYIGKNYVILTKQNVCFETALWIKTTSWFFQEHILGTLHCPDKHRGGLYDVDA